MKATLASRLLPNGTFDFSGGATAQLNYSPTLELLARIGDAIASEHNDQVRAEERAFGEELFDAFVADYNDARPAIIALDLDKHNQQEKSQMSRARPKRFFTAMLFAAAILSAGCAAEDKPRPPSPAPARNRSC